MARAWLTVGFHFYTDAMRAFLGGYEPVIAAEMVRTRLLAAKSAEKEASYNAGRLSGAKQLRVIRDASKRVNDGGGLARLKAIRRAKGWQSEPGIKGPSDG